MFDMKSLKLPQNDLKGHSKTSVSICFKIVKTKFVYYKYYYD